MWEAADGGRSLVLVFGTVLEHSRKLNVVETAVLDRRIAEQRVHLFVRETITHCRHNFSEPVLTYGSTIVRIKTLECIPNHVLRVRASQFFTEQGEEHCKIDVSRCFTNHLLNQILGNILSKRCEHVLQILIADETIVILVNHVKGLLELLNLCLVKHGKNVRSGALRSRTTTNGFA